MIGFISTSITLSLLIIINTILSVIYTIYSSLLHSPSSLFISWQWLSTQKLMLQITMRSSCYFVFSHSVLLCPSLYSIFTVLERHALFSSLYSQLLNPPGLFSVMASCPWLTASQLWLTADDLHCALYTFGVDPIETPIIVAVFTVLLLSTGHGVDHVENKSHDSNRSSPLACWLLHSNKL